jgi:reactive chlorine resistance protein C
MNYSKLESSGTQIIRYGLAIVLCWIGILKFTDYEAAGIQPLVENSPLMSWAYRLMSVQAFAAVLGVVEILSGLLIACRPFAPKLAAAGGIAGMVTFLVTLTLLLSTPGVLQPGYSFPFISPMPGQFVLKDIVLLGASAYTAGEAMRAADKATTITNL